MDLEAKEEGQKRNICYRGGESPSDTSPVSLPFFTSRDVGCEGVCSFGSSSQIH